MKTFLIIRLNFPSVIWWCSFWLPAIKLKRCVSRDECWSYCASDFYAHFLYLLIYRAFGVRFFFLILFLRSSVGLVFVFRSAKHPPWVFHSHSQKCMYLSPITYFFLCCYSLRVNSHKMRFTVLLLFFVLLSSQHAFHFRFAFTLKFVEKKDSHW